MIANRLKGIEVNEPRTLAPALGGAGENWHQLVALRAGNNMPRHGDLALITARGTSPIQNIVARMAWNYSASATTLTALKTGNGKRLRLSAECRFGYRDGIFKNEYQDRVAIVAVDACVCQSNGGRSTYGDLTCLDRKRSPRNGV